MAARLLKWLLHLLPRFSQITDFNGRFHLCVIDRNLSLREACPGYTPIHDYNLIRQYEAMTRARSSKYSISFLSHIFSYVVLITQSTKS
jgi:hypothetical protein